MRRRRTACRTAGGTSVEVRSRPIPDADRVRDETRVFAPAVKLVSRRLERKAGACIWTEVEDDLMGRAWRCPGDRPGKPAFDWAMQVPACNALDLRVAADDLGECRTAVETEPVHVADPGQKWRVVHQHQSGPILRFREDAIDPAQPIRTQSPAPLARHQSIERD